MLLGLRNLWALYGRLVYLYPTCSQWVVRMILVSFRWYPWERAAVREGLVWHGVGSHSTSFTSEVQSCPWSSSVGSFCIPCC